MHFPLFLPFALSLLPQILPISLPSPFDCSFEPNPSNAKGFCAWSPDNEQSALLWHNGNAVLVDAANSLVHSADGIENRFAYAQGHFGSPTDGSLRSPPVADDRSEVRSELTLSYWKMSASPSLDICVEEGEHEPLRCVDTVQGPGQKQWVRRAVELPTTEKPFRIVLRARNLLSAEDIVAVDDVRLLPSAQNRADTFLRGISEGGTAPRNPFDGMGDEEPEQKQQQQRKLTQTKIVAVKQQKGQQHHHSPIRPQIRLSPSLSHPTRPPGAPSSHANDQSHDPPIPRVDQLSFPTFDSPKMTYQKGGDERHCRAVSCTFMDGNCLWQLGLGWHNTSEGSLSIQTPVQFSQVISAFFKPALTSSVDFDLWMSENTEITVVEKQIGKENERTDILLFTRHGATDGGWHRFRVPLRSSFSPVRLIFRVKIDQEMRQIHPNSNFISISNLKLVNGDGNEIGCETIDEEEAKVLKMIPPEAMSASSAAASDDFFGLHQPSPLQLPSQFPLPPPLLVVPSPSFPSQFSPPSPFPPIGPPSSPFNPFSPMFEGFLPIVPLRDNPPRLTALMDAPIQQREHSQANQQHLLLLSPLATKEKEFLEEEDENGRAAEQQQSPQGLLPIGTKTVDEGAVPTSSEESVESDGKRRHQLKRVIRPESHLREVLPNNPQLVVLTRGRKWGRKGQTNNEKTDGGEESLGWPMAEMGATEHRSDKGEKGKSEKSDEFRRRH